MIEDLIKSVKRILDLAYVYLAFWGVAQFIEWIGQFAN